MRDKPDHQFNRTSSDHYLHWLGTIVVSFWAGVVWGWPAGIGYFVALFAIISVTNSLLLAKTGSFRVLRVNRWAWLIVALVTVLISSAQTGTVVEAR